MQIASSYEKRAMMHICCTIPFNFRFECGMTALVCLFLAANARHIAKRMPKQQYRYSWFATKWALLRFSLLIIELYLISMSIYICMWMVFVQWTWSIALWHVVWSWIWMRWHRRCGTTRCWWLLAHACANDNNEICAWLFYESLLGRVQTKKFHALNVLRHIITNNN